MIRKTKFVSGEYYHLYNRGVDKRNIFKKPEDQERFLALLYICNSTDRQKNLRDHLRQGRSLTEVYEVKKKDSLVGIGAYCLMPNHFHILITECEDGGVSLFMQRITTAYSMYFNKKYDRTGALFEGRFKSEHAGHDVYLKYLYSYIHLNPVKLLESKWKEKGIQDVKRAKNYLKNFRFSSYRDYLGEKRKERKILSPKAFPAYFLNNLDFERCTNEMLTYQQFNGRQGRSLTAV